MERQWYLSRDGKVFGPVTDAQLAEAVAAGRVLPTDQLNVAGLPEWRLATDVPGLLPAASEPEVVEVVEVVDLAPVDLEPIDLAPVSEPVKVRVTCMACFRQVTVTVMPGDTSSYCPMPKCRSAIELEGPVKAPPPRPGNDAFSKLESKRAFKERLQKKDPTSRTGARNRDDD